MEGGGKHPPPSATTRQKSPVLIGLSEWIRLFKGALKGHQTLFIIDDCSAEGEINKK